MLNVISRSPSDIQPVLDAIVDTAARLCRGDFAIIWKLYEGRYHAASIASDTTPELAAYARANPIELSRETLVGRVALERATVHIPDVTRDAEYRWSDGRWARTAPYDARGASAARGRGHRSDRGPSSEVSAVLSERNRSRHNFSDQAVIAISNVGLFEQVQARTAELQESSIPDSYSDVLSVISRSPSQIQPVLDTIVETAAHLCDAKRAFIYRYDGSVLRHQASHNASAELIDFVTRNPISPGRHSGVARAAVEKRTVHISDVRSDPEYTFGAAQVDPICTVLAVPMLKANDLVGVLVIYRFEVRPFTEKQIELVTTFADQAVIAIENVRLFKEVQARTAELQEALEYQTATSDVLNVISRSPSDLQPVLAAVGEKAARLCEADNAVIFRLEGDLLRQVGAFGKTPAISGPLNRARVVTRAVVRPPDRFMSMTCRQKLTNSRRAALMRGAQGTGQRWPRPCCGTGFRSGPFSFGAWRCVRSLASK